MIRGMSGAGDNDDDGGGRKKGVNNDNILNKLSLIRVLSDIPVYQLLFV